MTFVPYPSIDQFRNVIREVSHIATYKGQDANDQPIYDPNAPRPTIRFCGTVKLHGTNAGVTRTPDGTMIAQSRSKALPEGQDNMGFRAFMVANKDAFETLFNRIGYQDKTVTVFGEWAGQGIQGGVAISKVPKFFAFFGIKIGEEWLTAEQFPADLEESRIINVNRFGSYAMDIDFSCPERSQNALGDITTKVEEHCPAGAYFGVEGVGEGVVWTAFHKNKMLQFKVKGEKHSVSKVKTLASVDVEKLDSIQALVSSVVTEQRLQQGLQAMQEQGLELSSKTIGPFIGWVSRDVMKEEADTIEKNGFTTKDVGFFVTAAARKWYVSRMMNELNEAVND